MQNKKDMQNTQHAKDGKQPEQPVSGPLASTHLQNKGNLAQNTSNFPQSVEKDGN